MRKTYYNLDTIDFTAIRAAQAREAEDQRKLEAETRTLSWLLCALMATVMVGAVFGIIGAWFADPARVEAFLASII